MQRHVPGASVYNNDYVGIASYNIFVGIAIATIFGAAFFFDLFWPERYESPAVKLSWKISSVVVILMALADAIAYTVRIPFFSRAPLEAMTSVLIRIWFSLPETMIITLSVTTTEPLSIIFLR